MIYPCDECEVQNTKYCPYFRSCPAWLAWFKKEWDAETERLRKKYKGENDGSSDS